MTTQANTTSEISHEIGASGRFVLRITSGDVRIVGTDTSVARVRERNGRSLAERFEIGLENGSLELVSRKRFGLTLSIDHHQWGAGTPDLDIEVPAHATIVIDTASGDIVTRGLGGSQRFRTASGDLALQASGGDIDLDAVSGDVRIDSTGVLDLCGKTISGDLRVRAPRLSRFDMATTSGDMQLDAQLSGKGPFSIKTISGDVTLVARGDLQVEAQMITGDLVSEVNHRRESLPGRKILVIGRPGPVLAFKSVSGDLQIVEAREQQVTDMTDIDFPGRPGGSEPTPESPAADRPDLAETKRLEILRALERGEIDVDAATERLTAAEAAPILDALSKSTARGSKASGNPPGTGPVQAGSATGGLGEGQSGDGGERPRFARIQVLEGGRRSVDLRVPVGLGRFALSRVPGLSGDQINEVQEALASGTRGPILDIQDADGDGVRITLE